MNKKSNQQKLKELLPIINNNDVAKRHFYEKIDASWLKDLVDADALKLDLSLSTISDDQYYRDWIEGRYLSRISKDNPQGVYDVIKSLDLKDQTNPLIYEIIIEVLVNVAETNDVTEVVHKIISENWIGNKGRATFLSFKLKDLISNLIKTQSFDLINTLLSTLLAFRLPDNYLETSKRRFTEPLAVIESYSLEEILKEISGVKYKDENQLVQILKTISNAFDHYLELTRDLKEYENDSEYEDYSFIWKSAIDYDKDRLHDIKEDFVIAIREVIINNPEIIGRKVIETLSGYKKRIFQRLRLYLAGKITISEEIIVQEILNNITDRHNIHELRELLISKYALLSKENKRKVLNKIGESFSDSEEKYRTAYKAELIKPIADYLTDAEKVEFESILSSQWEYVPSYRFNGMKSGPNPRYSKDDLLAKSHAELVEIFKEDEIWFNKNVHNEGMFSPRGLGRLWQTIVTEKYEDYINNLSIYDPREILPLYINHLLTGLEASTSNYDSKVNWAKLIFYSEWILEIYEKGDFHTPSEKDSFDVGDNEEVLISLLRLLENGLRGKNSISITLKEKVWGIITKIYNLAHDTDESFVEKNDKDYFTHSINSIGGLLLHNIYYYAFWVINKKKLKSYPDEVIEFISGFLDSHLEYKTGASVMGKYLPWTERYSKLLFDKQKEKLLTIDDKGIRYVSWETYLANSIFLEPYRKLRDVYIQSINELGSDIPDRRYWADPKNTLLEHVMVGFIHELDDPTEKKTLFDLLLETKRTKEIAYAVDFVGRAYASSDNQSKKNLPEKHLQRIKSIWEIVLKSNLDSEVYENFGWWVKKDYYNDNKWLLQMLINTLNKSNGYIDPDFKVLEQLNLLAEESPTLVGEALEKMVKSTKKEKTYYFRDKEVILIIEKLEKNTNKAVLNHIKEIRDTLVGYGYTQYAK